MFKVYDNYESKEFLGAFETKKQAIKCAKQREKDTDGECYCVVIGSTEDWKHE